tara:strand:+ start:661 stop:1359 length:699 start_codon:yes stop_codon:yes gene_type:complete
MNFLFDVDGTLTPARKPMIDKFRRLFGHWVARQQSNGDKVFFVTGSDKDKTIEQVGLALWRLVDGSYQCSGNQLYKRGRLIKESRWLMSADLRLDILNILEKSRWYGRAKNNIEERTGMINISTVGRSCDNILRKEYFEWDKRNHERTEIAEDLSKKYPQLEFSIGGEISIDIYPKGNDKSQVLADMKGRSFFFGDMCHVGGNDYALAVMCDNYYNVNSWKQTMSLLLEPPI